MPRLRNRLLVLLAVPGLGTVAVGEEPSNTRHVLIVGVDGLSPEGIRIAATPVLERLMREGASSMRARAVMPTSSSSNWASMIMGAGPEQHGITSNDWQRQTHSIPPTTTGAEGIFPTIFGAAREAHPTAAIGVFHDWDGFGRLVDASSCTVVTDTDGPLDTTARAVAFIESERPLLTFVHLDHVDQAGHTHGWHTASYLEAVAVADRLIGDLLAALDRKSMADDTLVMVSSDHGGIAKGHGGATLAEIEIPWIARGPGIRPGTVITAPINQYDTAATVAHALEIAPPAGWIGRPVRAAYADD